MISKPRLRATCGAAAMILGAGTAAAFSVETNGITLSVNGNVNANLTYVACDKHADTVKGSLLCSVGPGEGKSSATSINSGNLPNGIVFGVKTALYGVDSAVVFGFYPGIVNNDYASSTGGANGPNLGALGGNYALGTTNNDIRQLYATFGTKDLGQLKIGRDYSPVGFDAILNDITLISVGVASVRTARSPANTTLGTIGFGHIFPTPQAAITYTTPDYSGVKVSFGVFQPLDAISASGTGASSANSLKGLPGFQGKVRYDLAQQDGFSGFIGGTGLYQQQDLNVPGPGATLTSQTPKSVGGDVTGKLAYGPFAVVASYYLGTGLGVYGYFIDGFSATGEKRFSNGGYLQGTYTLGKTTFGANYGISKLDAGKGDTDALLLKSNSKFTVGVYHKLFPNLTLTSEFTNAKSKSIANGTIETQNVNVGFFVSF